MSYIYIYIYIYIYDISHLRVKHNAVLQFRIISSLQLLITRPPPPLLIQIDVTSVFVISWANDSKCARPLVGLTVSVIFTRISRHRPQSYSELGYK